MDDFKKFMSQYGGMIVGILIAMEKVQKHEIQSFLEKTLFLGELSLDGKINQINGVLPICIEAVKKGLKRILLPKENAKEASIVKGIEIYAVDSLKQVVEFLDNEKILQKESEWQNEKLGDKKYPVDFSEVKGQETAKRALEIAAARWT